jgi:quercetin dioxygenase-like cupin family protein
MSYERKIIRKARDYRWEGVDVLPYKEDARALYRTITRQVLFTDPNLHAELRYFEIAPGGFSTLERHAHMHAVLILRGRGNCLVGTRVSAVELRDLVTVPPLTWHQFRAGADDPLGCLCMVDAARDKPQLPSPDDLAQLNEHPQVAAFLSGAIRRTEVGGHRKDKERSDRSPVLRHSSSGE